MKTTDDERSAYEIFVCEHWPRSVLERRNQPGHIKHGWYRKPEIQWGWETWTASCESRVIQLPGYLDTDRIGFAAYDAVTLENALEDAGVKYK